MEQLNVRMDSELKEKGTAALASIGLTPTEAVRALWQRAAERGESLEKVRALVEGEPAEEETTTYPNGFREAWKAMDETLKILGLDKAAPLDLTDEELMELEYRDRGML